MKIRKFEDFEIIPNFAIRVKKMTMAKILVIDDERSIRNSMKDILSFEGHEVVLAENGMEGLVSVKTEKPEVVFCDIKMPKMEGIEVLERIKEFTSDVPVIMISGHGTIDTAIEAIKKGAYDFIEKPLDLNRILITIKNATDKNQLIEETQKLKTKVSKKYEMIGHSDALNHIRIMIDKVAVSDARVLITGPNGCGKELVAHQLHEKSHRNDRAFIEVNCAAIPSELIESELFGHERGAFTSAIKQRRGKFEQADGGTLFMDEHCSIDPDAPTANWLIYGHNMADGSMFGQLTRYRSEDFYKAHTTFTFNTIYETAAWQVVAALDTTLGADELPYYTFFDADTKLEWQQRVDAITALSLYDTGVTPAYGQQLLVLSTCGTSSPTAKTRFALLAVRCGEN